MICPNCRKFLSIKDNFCSYCGIKNEHSKKRVVYCDCPVCNLKIKKTGLKNHIAGRARFEAYRNNADKKHFEYLQKYANETL